MNNNDQKMRAIIIGKELWNHIDKNIEGIREYLSGECNRENSGMFLYYSLKLVAIELMLNREKYIDFPELKYSEEDFVDIIINGITAEVPDIEDIEDCKKHHNDCRRLAWGYIKSRYKDILTVIEDMHTESISESMDAKAICLMCECLTVVYTEALIRRKELFFLEESIG